MSFCSAPPSPRHQPVYLPPQQGNALFLILIAVALFAALSFAVTQSGRGSGDTSREQALIGAAQVTQIGASLQTAATRMRVAGTPLDAILLNSTSGAYGNNDGRGSLPCDTTDENCIFNPGAGAVFPQLPQHVGKAGAAFQPTPFLYEVADDAIVDGVAGNRPVLLLIIRNLNKNVCERINAGLGVTGMPDDPNYCPARQPPATSPPTSRTATATLSNTNTITFLAPPNPRPERFS